MTAYILLNVRHFNPDRQAMRPYAEHVQPTMAAYGGRYRRGLAHRIEVLEGEWHPRALGMLEFPTFGVFERMMATLPSLSSEARRRIVGRCRELDSMPSHV